MPLCCCHPQLSLKGHFSSCPHAKAQGSPLSSSSQGSQQLPTKTWPPAQPACAPGCCRNIRALIFLAFFFVCLLISSSVQQKPACVQDCRAALVLVPALVLHHLMLRVGESLSFAWTPPQARGFLMSTPDPPTSIKSSCPSRAAPHSSTVSVSCSAQRNKAACQHNQENSHKSHVQLPPTPTPR